MQKVFKIASFGLIFINVMLVFLFLFENNIQIPSFLEPLGRLHPLLLHLPIGVFFVAVLLRLLKTRLQFNDSDEVLNLLLMLAAVLTSITALVGLVLAQESGYEASQIRNHKWLGVSTSLLCWFAYLGFLNKWKWEGFITGIAAFGILISGHLGGEITHGENYVLASLTKSEKVPFNPEGGLFEEAVFPILEAKCISCHNDKKQKGELNLSSLSKLLVGGEEGPVWVAGDALNSHIVQHLKLPLEDKKHMPPKGKPQLTATEIAILELWIAKGAKPEITYSELQSGDTLKGFIQSQYLQTVNETKTYNFKAASDSDIEKVNTPFCTVSSLALGSPALRAEFYVAQKFDLATLKALKNVETQLVEISLAKMPLKDQDLELLVGYRNLEKLNLNFTEIKGEGLAFLKANQKLENLSISGSKLTSGSLKHLLPLKSLKVLYVWETGLADAEITEFEKKNPRVKVIRGFVPTDKDILKINPPIMVSKTGIVKKAELKHSLKDVIIRYTTDGSKPDSLKGELYKDEIPFDGFVKVNAIATKEGWYASNPKTFTFFKSVFKADSAWLITEADKDYLGKGAETVIDLKQGLKSNFKDFAWLGYKLNPAEVLIQTKEGDKLNGLTASYLLRPGSFIMPPTEVELWGGNEKGKLQLLEKKYPKALGKEENETAFDGISFAIQKQYKYYKIVAKPLAKLPSWHTGAGQKAWFFIDEIYFY
jgi:uncharacterized membrane protein